MTHPDLIQHAADWLAQQGMRPVITEPRTRFGMTGEVPDVCSWGEYGTCAMVECKASRADFKADRHKPHRKEPGVGSLRYFCFPVGLVEPYEVDAALYWGWGVLYCDEDGNVTEAVQPQQQPSPRRAWRIENAILIQYALSIKFVWERAKPSARESSRIRDFAEAIVFTVKNYSPCKPSLVVGSVYGLARDCGGRKQACKWLLDTAEAGGIPGVAVVRDGGIRYLEATS